MQCMLYIDPRFGVRGGGPESPPPNPNPLIPLGGAAITDHGYIMNSFEL